MQGIRPSTWATDCWSTSVIQQHMKMKRRARCGQDWRLLLHCSAFLLPRPSRERVGVRVMDDQLLLRPLTLALAPKGRGNFRQLSLKGRKDCRSALAFIQVLLS